MSPRRSAGSETDEVINHRTDKDYVPGDNPTVEDKTFEGVSAQPVFLGAVLLSIVSLFVAQEELDDPILLYLIVDLGDLLIFKIDDQLWLLLQGPGQFLPCHGPMTGDHLVFPLYSKSGMKRDYGLREELHPRCRAAPVDYSRAPLDRRMSYRDDYPPPPEESAYKFKMEEIMSPSQDKDFVLFAPPPRMVNGSWIHYPAIAYPNEERGFKFGREELPCEGEDSLLFVPPGMVNGLTPIPNQISTPLHWNPVPTTTLPAEESGFKFKREETTSPLQGRELCDWEPCGICGGKHDWCSCPLRWACPFDREVGKDFEVVCRCSVWNCTERCTYPIGKAVFKNPLPFIF
ncbi:hypothetical protein CASFOL_011296 [Castilleja foliolosa]|uniref:Uncharacterized protein n=1 Tax=Castilleja foliolosa TaxID=1961234 RepID=A0ABD3DV30_9LAMI